jgi:hypothetical protein
VLADAEEPLPESGWVGAETIRDGRARQAVVASAMGRLKRLAA